MTLRPYLLALVLVLLGGCRGTNVQQRGCKEDKDCGVAAAWRCETQTGECYCRTNEACKPSEICNPAGFCQTRAGCLSNAECAAGLFCDTMSGVCLQQGRCTNDLHCPLGQVCDVGRASCVDGCHGSGDCAKGACRCGDKPCRCTGKTPAEVSTCTVGTCDEQFCGDQNDCLFGELCAAPDAGTLPDGGAVEDAGTQRNVCFSDYDDRRRPYCDNCSFGGGVSICGSGPNYCLIDTRNPGNFYCGVDCSAGQSCPRGYACSDVIVVFTQWACSKANPSCPVNPNLVCTQDSDCKRGGVCIKSGDAGVGACAGKCAVDEGDTQGFCTCQENADCAQESCSMGECSISRKKCVTSDDCKSIRCVDFQGGGGCLIGQNCAPANGLSCVEVR